MTTSTKRPAEKVARSRTRKASDLPPEKKLSEKEMQTTIHALLQTNHPNALKKY